MSFSRCAKTNYESKLVTRVRRDGCSLDTRTSDYTVTILDCDQFPSKPGEKSADYLVIAEPKRAFSVVVELKGGSIHHPNHVAAQLQAGADQLREVLRTCPLEVKLVPLLLYGGSIHPAHVATLKRHKIRMGDKVQPISLARCGAKLEDILD